MNFSEAERQLLVAVGKLKDHNKTADLKTLALFNDYYYGEELLDWTAAFKTLTKNQMLKEKNGVYLLTKQGIERAYKLIAGIESSQFALKCEKSKTYSEFCERVHYQDLCQNNMIDMEQLIEVLNLSPDNRVLDVGCGIGIITEYISDKTGECVQNNRWEKGEF
ncbi:class I SAM-dependent methyltransferase [candidate division CSSED10-310 bacterium]|uniref:Class I SAM-dependent methyltransferase n=1 Tax=candidate division CSSED10-310 bacterium TaxID=2855610 RepID=A0ABV6Z2Q1_UNCC1